MPLAREGHASMRRHSLFHRKHWWREPVSWPGGGQTASPDAVRPQERCGAGTRLANGWGEILAMVRTFVQIIAAPARENKPFIGGNAALPGTSTTLCLDGESRGTRPSLENGNF
jgi:hypothetical protein